MNKTITVCWLTNFSCNYGCPYCILKPHWEYALKRDRYFSIKQILSAWTNLRNRYGEVNINISGGEPTIYPDFLNIIKELSMLHRIDLNTNLSIPIDSIMEHLDASRINLSVAFHPFFMKITDMVCKLNALKTKGWNVEVACVAWPPLIHNLEYYQSLLQNLNFQVLPFRGIYDDRLYPFSYTQKEKEIINKYIADRQGVKFSTEPPKVTGRMCRAGQVYANIMPDGAVLRCGSGQEVIHKDFFDGNFTFLDKPAPCKAEHCDCLDWVVCE